MKAKSIVLMVLFLFVNANIINANIKKVGGLISTKETWSNDTILVTGNITIDSGVVLVIKPGVLVLFQSKYYITVHGTISAIGTTEKKILFTSEDTLGIGKRWGGIWFENETNNNDTSKIINCIFSYGYTGINAHGYTQFYAGAINVIGFNKLIIKACSPDFVT